LAIRIVRLFCVGCRRAPIGNRPFWASATPGVGLRRRENSELGAVAVESGIPMPLSSRCRFHPDAAFIPVPCADWKSAFLGVGDAGRRPAPTRKQRAWGRSRRKRHPNAAFIPMPLLSRCRFYPGAVRRLEIGLSGRRRRRASACADAKTASLGP